MKIKFPRMTAVVGDCKDNSYEGQRTYFPKIIVHKTQRHNYEQKITINVGGNHFKARYCEDYLDAFDRMALLFAAAPQLAEALVAVLRAPGIDKTDQESGDTYRELVLSALAKAGLDHEGGPKHRSIPPTKIQEFGS